MPKHAEYVQQLNYLKVNLNEIENIIQEHKTIKHYAYIIHDKDVDKTGTPIVPHLHLYLNFGNSNASFSDIAKWFNDDECHVNKVNGKMKDMLLYLTHKNAKDKYQYDNSEVKSNFDYTKKIIELNTQDEIFKTIDTTVFAFTSDKATFSQTTKKMQEIKQSLTDRKALTYWLKAEQQIQAVWKSNCAIATKKKRDMQIVFIYGDSGSGKSTYAELYAKMLCDKKGYRDYARSSASNDIFQDYMGEDIFILDDYRDKDEMTGETQNLTDVLKMLDPHFASSSKSRYVNKTFVGKLIIITSTKDPLTWFADTKEQRWQFFRRISMLIKIDKNNIYEYQEINTENGTPFLCGFSREGNYIQNAELKTTFKNPVQKYIEKLIKIEKPLIENSAESISDYINNLLPIFMA